MFCNFRLAVFATCFIALFTAGRAHAVSREEYEDMLSRQNDLYKECIENGPGKHDECRETAEKKHRGLFGTSDEDYRIDLNVCENMFSTNDDDCEASRNYYINQLERPDGVSSPPVRPRSAKKARLERTSSAVSENKERKKRAAGSAIEESPRSAKASSAGARSRAAKGGLSDLTCSAQDKGNSMFITGTYRGKPVHMVRRGKRGSGKWMVYAGSPTDRVRLTIDDTKGLQEVLAVDSGQRITVNVVEMERVEYRFYAPGSGAFFSRPAFVVGAVLYRKNDRWLQGIMKSEAFPGYFALTDVSDVTGKITAQAAAPETTIFGWLNGQWQDLELIPIANAWPNWLDEYISESPQDARNRWSAPGHEMVKAGIVGIVAVTTKVAEVLIATGEVASVGSAVVVAAPFVASVGIGVGVGIVLEKGYDWALAKYVNDSSVQRAEYDQWAASTSYTRQSPPAVPNPLVASWSEPRPRGGKIRAGDPRADAMNQQNADEEHRKEREHQKYQKEMDLAEECVNNHDFERAVEHFNKANKWTNSYSDYVLLAAARQNMADLRERIAEEARQQADVAAEGSGEEAPAEALPEQVEREAEETIQHIEPVAVVSKTTPVRAAPVRASDTHEGRASVGSKPATDCGRPGEIRQRSATPQSCSQDRFTSYLGVSNWGPNNQTRMNMEEVCTSAMNGSAITRNAIPVASSNVNANDKRNMSACFCNGAEGQNIECWVYFDN